MPLYSTKVPTSSSPGRSRCNTRVIASSSNSRSWLITSRAPRYWRRKLSNQFFASTSRWLVGSSSNNMSLPANKMRASSTRRRSPPERTPSCKSRRSGLSPKPAAMERASLSAEYPPLSRNSSSALVYLRIFASLAFSSMPMRNFSKRVRSSSMLRPDKIWLTASRPSNCPAARGSCDK